MIGVVTMVMIALFTSVTQGLTSKDTGVGLTYKLEVTQDVTLRESNMNTNRWQYLLVSKNPDFPNARSPIAFEDLPSTCRVKIAKMYLYYPDVSRISWQPSITKVPFIPRYLQVHLVKTPWNEAQATSTLARRLGGRRPHDEGQTYRWPWHAEYLGVDGSDAEATPQGSTVTIFPFRPPGFVEFDITNAMQSWQRGEINNSLLIRATNELLRGREISFASKEYSDTSKHPFARVLCE